MMSPLKPVPSLHKKLVLDQSLSRLTKGSSADRSFDNAKFMEPTDDVIRQRRVLVPIEVQKDAPFLVSEVSPSDHDGSLSVGPINDSTLLEYDGIKQPITEWALDYGITPAIIIGRLERGMGVADAVTTPMRIGHVGQRLPALGGKRPRKSPSGRPATRHICSGLSLTYREWADRFGVDVRTFKNRKDRVGSLEAAVAYYESEQRGGCHRTLSLQRGPARGAPCKRRRI